MRKLLEIFLIGIFCISMVGCDIVEEDSNESSFRWNQETIDHAYVLFREKVFAEYGYSLGEKPAMVSETEYNGEPALYVGDGVDVDTLFGIKRAWFEADVLITENGEITEQNIFIREPNLDFYFTETDLLRSHEKFHQYYNSFDTDFKKEAFLERMEGGEVKWTIIVESVDADDGLFDKASIISETYDSSDESYYCQFYFNTSDEKPLFSISPGEKITISGMFRSKNSHFGPDEYAVSSSKLVSRTIAGYEISYDTSK